MIRAFVFYGGSMSVYFIRMEGSNLFKIGYAIDPPKRLTMLQVGCPYELELFGVIEGAGMNIESSLHARYKQHRVRGEWFELDHRAITKLVSGQDSIDNYVAPTKGDLRTVANNEPDLTKYGFYWKHKQAKALNDDVCKFTTDRTALYNTLDEFAFCCRWLAKCYRVKKFTRSSYGLKHDVERYYDIYIPNGALIAATIHMGFKWKRCGMRHPNAEVAIGVPQTIIIQTRDSRYLPGGKELKEQS